MESKLETRDFFDWLNYKLFANEEDDPDLYHIECSLIRCMSEYRRAELSQEKFFKEFDKKFLAALEKEPTVYISQETPPFWSSRAFQYSLAFLCMGSLVALFSFFGLEKTIPNTVSSASASLDPDIFSELQEEFQLIKQIRDSNDIESLKVLEKYNLTNGITDRATRIHYTIELLSK
jgi:hypothetical protein